jgi:spore germination protein
MEINGYVYPNQDISILKEMLPFLTYLSIFSYTVNSDGSINSIPDEELIKLARSYNVAPMMVITNIDSNDTFNSDLARSILTNEAAQDKLITNILINLKAKNYYGLDVDFEFIYPEDKVKYNNFLRKVVDALHPKGYKVSTAVAPKTSTDMTGLLYEAHDYEAHGKIVDRIIIMTYEWGYTYSEAMPVAPLDRVQEVIEYAVTVIPNDKILMGIPNYGYDFRVPRLEDEPATSISNFEAIQIGRENLVAIEFDDEAMSPYFNYMNKDVVREVHFEDARSIKEKILLAIEYDLAGLSFWTLRTNFKPTWILIDYYLDVIKLI